MEYHRTKDILHVMSVLGHKRIQNTLKYTQLVDVDENEYISRVAKSTAEVCELVDAGLVRLRRRRQSLQEAEVTTVAGSGK